MEKMEIDEDEYRDPIPGEYGNPIPRELLFRELGFTERFTRFSVGTRAVSTTLATKAVHTLCTKEAFTRRKFKLPAGARTTFHMAFSPDGTKVASCHGDHNVYVCDVRSGEVLQTLSGHPRTPWCVVFHPTQNDVLASGCLAGHVRVWDLNGGSEVLVTDSGTVIASLAFHPTVRLLVIATFNEIIFWDWDLPYPLARCSTENTKEKVRLVRFDRLGKSLITGITNYPNPPAREGLQSTQNVGTHRPNILSRGYTRSPGGVYNQDDRPEPNPRADGSSARQAAAEDQRNDPHGHGEIAQLAASLAAAAEAEAASAVLNRRQDRFQESYRQLVSHYQDLVSHYQQFLRSRIPRLLETSRLVREQPLPASQSTITTPPESVERAARMEPADEVPGPSRLMQLEARLHEIMNNPDSAETASPSSAPSTSVPNRLRNDSDLRNIEMLAQNILEMQNLCSQARRDAPLTIETQHIIELQNIRRHLELLQEQTRELQSSIRATLTSLARNSLDALRSHVVSNHNSINSLSSLARGSLDALRSQRNHSLMPTHGGSTSSYLPSNPNTVNISSEPATSSSPNSSNAILCITIGPRLTASAEIISPNSGNSSSSGPTRTQVPPATTMQYDIPLNARPTISTASSPEPGPSYRRQGGVSGDNSFPLRRVIHEYYLSGRRDHSEVEQHSRNCPFSGRDQLQRPPPRLRCLSEMGEALTLTVWPTIETGLLQETRNFRGVNRQTPRINNPPQTSSNPDPRVSHDSFAAANANINLSYNNPSPAAGSITTHLFAGRLNWISNDIGVHVQLMMRRVAASMRRNGGEGIENFENWQRMFLGGFALIPTWARHGHRPECCWQRRVLRRGMFMMGSCRSRQEANSPRPYGPGTLDDMLRYSGGQSSTNPSAATLGPSSAVFGPSSNPTSSSSVPSSGSSSAHLPCGLSSSSHGGNLNSTSTGNGTTDNSTSTSSNSRSRTGRSLPSQLDGGFMLIYHMRIGEDIIPVYSTPENVDTPNSFSLMEGPLPHVFVFPVGLFLRGTSWENNTQTVGIFWPPVTRDEEENLSEARSTELVQMHNSSVRTPIILRSENFLPRYRIAYDSNQMELFLPEGMSLVVVQPGLLLLDLISTVANLERPRPIEGNFYVDYISSVLIALERLFTHRPSSSSFVLQNGNVPYSAARIARNPTNPYRSPQQLSRSWIGSQPIPNVDQQNRTSDSPGASYSFTLAEPRINLERVDRMLQDRGRRIVQAMHEEGIQPARNGSTSSSSANRSGRSNPQSRSASYDNVQAAEGGDTQEGMNAARRVIRLAVDAGESRRESHQNSRAQMARRAIESRIERVLNERGNRGFDSSSFSGTSGQQPSTMNPGTSSQDSSIEALRRERQLRLEDIQLRICMLTQWPQQRQGSSSVTSGTQTSTSLIGTSTPTTTDSATNTTSTSTNTSNSSQASVSRGTRRRHMMERSEARASATQQNTNSNDDEQQQPAAARRPRLSSPFTFPSVNSEDVPNRNDAQTSTNVFANAAVMTDWSSRSPNIWQPIVPSLPVSDAVLAEPVRGSSSNVVTSSAAADRYDERSSVRSSSGAVIDQFENLISLGPIDLALGSGHPTTSRNSAVDRRARLSASERLTAETMETEDRPSEEPSQTDANRNLRQRRILAACRNRASRSRHTRPERNNTASESVTRVFQSESSFPSANQRSSSHSLASAYSSAVPSRSTRSFTFNLPSDLQNRYSTVSDLQENLSATEPLLLHLRDVLAPLEVSRIDNSRRTEPTMQEVEEPEAFREPHLIVGSAVPFDGDDLEADILPQNRSWHRQSPNTFPGLSPSNERVEETSPASELPFQRLRRALASANSVLERIGEATARETISALSLEDRNLPSTSQSTRHSGSLQNVHGSSFGNHSERLGFAGNVPESERLDMGHTPGLHDTHSRYLERIPRSTSGSNPGDSPLRTPEIPLVRTIDEATARNAVSQMMNYAEPEPILQVESPSAAPNSEFFAPNVEDHNILGEPMVSNESVPNESDTANPRSRAPPPLSRHFGEWFLRRRSAPTQTRIRVTVRSGNGRAENSPSPNPPSELGGSARTRIGVNTSSGSNTRGGGGNSANNGGAGSSSGEQIPRRYRTPGPGMMPPYLRLIHNYPQFNGEDLIPPDSGARFYPGYIPEILITPRARPPTYYTMDAATTAFLSSRIQKWDFSEFCIPDITDRSSGLITASCSLLSDATLDVSADSEFIAVLQPSDNGSYSAVGIYSLRDDTLGESLYTYHFDQNTVSVSISPSCDYIVVGYAGRGPFYRIVHPSRNIGQILSLTRDGPQIKLVPVKELFADTQPTLMSVNCMHWVPVPGYGIIYGTNTGEVVLLS